MSRNRLEQTALSEVVATISQAVVSAAAKTMELTARAPRPQLHMFTGDVDQPYVGYLETRDFYRGEDAARAISGLGYPLATLPASRLLMVWEHADLLTALELPQPVREGALVALHASVDHHWIDWHPYTAARVSPSGIAMTWGQPHTLDRPTLPAPVAEMFAIWRRFTPGDFGDVIGALIQNGYEFTPVTIRPAESPP